MELSKLSKTTNKGKRRLGQGHGSGRVKTSGRGTKGQKARGKIPQRLKFAGVSFVKRLPLIRGKLRLKNFRGKPLIVNLKDLEGVKANTVIDLSFLVAEKFLKKDESEVYSVKILGDGKISVPLIIKLKTS